MKFICCSDTHGVVPPILNEIGVDAWIHAGDFLNRVGNPCGGSNTNLFAYNKISLLTEWLDTRSIPVYSVRGNHDIPVKYAPAIKDISGSIQKVGPKLHLIGLGWSGSVYFELPREKDLAEICVRVMNEASSKMDPGDHSIIVTHYPPANKQLFDYDFDPNGWLFDCVKKTVEAFRPLAVIQGHVHELFGFNKSLDGTLYVFPGPKGGYLNVDVEKATASWDPAQ